MKIDLKEQKDFYRLLSGFQLILCLINIGLCIAGMLPHSLFTNFVEK